MIQMLRDVIEHARTASTLGFVRLCAGRTGDMEGNALAQKCRVSQGAKIALSLFPVLGMPAVSDEDPGA